MQSIVVPYEVKSKPLFSLDVDLFKKKEKRKVP